MCRHFTITELYNLMFWWCLSVYCSSGEKNQSTCRDDSDMPVEQWSIFRMTPILIIDDVMISLIFCHSSIYLSIPMRIPPPHWKIWIWDRKPAWIWTPISWTKSGYANLWATLHCRQGFFGWWRHEYSKFFCSPVSHLIALLRSL